MTISLIDTHSHLTYDGLIGDIKGVLERSRKAGVTGWITVGTSLDQSRSAIELAARYDNMYAAIGVHPHHAKDVVNADLDELKKLARQPKIVAIGETGLDFHYNFSTPDTQKEIFFRHLEMAAELNLPVILHSRNAFDETMEILKQFEGKIPKMVFHCFGGDATQAKFLIERGYYISFTGVVTFKNAAASRDAVAVVDIDRLMIETDCPYISPEPMRKQKVNEPALMIHTAAKIAEIKQMPLEDLACKTTQTARQFFNLAFT